MKIRILLFGQVQEAAGRAEMELENIASLAELRTILSQKIPLLTQINYLTALNQEVVKGDAGLKDGDEIAIMPPFAGG
ncbi:MAG: MoaD/ThiS family protein [Bacteroidia bacterium]|nr:MoaD/ThiS family protein [Bacteroidia bacterium]